MSLRILSTVSVAAVVLISAAQGFAEDVPREIWTFSAGDQIFAPVFDRGHLYFGSTDGNLYCLSAETGDVVWKSDVDATIYSAPAIAGDRVSVAASTGTFPRRDTYGPNRLIAVDSTTGDLAWNVELGPGFTSAPQVAGDTVIAYAGPFVRAYALADGAERWEYKHRTGPVFGVAVSGETVIAAGTDGRVFALGLADGALRWEQSLDARSFFQPAVIGNLVLAGSMKGTVFALKQEDGAPVWTHATGGGLEGGGAVADGSLIFGNRAAEVFSLDVNTGNVKWSAHYDRPSDNTSVFSDVSVCDGLAVLGTFDRKIIAFDAGSGERVWTLSTSRPLPSLVCDDGRLFYTGMREGVLHALALH